jgi:hypothetical protein
MKAAKQFPNIPGNNGLFLNYSLTILIIAQTVLFILVIYI